MPKDLKRDLSKIVHIDKDTHTKLKKFVTKLQINDYRTSLALETEKAIKKHISKNS